jgi:hypothetical protein
MRTRPVAQGAEHVERDDVPGALPDGVHRNVAEHAGFADVDVWLNDQPTPFDSAAHFHDFLESVCLRESLATMPEEDRSTSCRPLSTPCRNAPSTTCA